MKSNLKMVRESSSSFLMHKLPVDSLQFHSNKYKGREKTWKGWLGQLLDILDAEAAFKLKHLL